MARRRPPDRESPEPTSASSPVLDFLQRHPRGVVLACFFCSGATGLIYEVVWSRRLTLVFGVTVLAYSTVLAAFLGGLAAGSLIFGRIADRRSDPLRLYAMLEAAIGLFCFLTPWLFALVERGYVAVYPAIGEQLWLLRLVRFGLAAGVMIVPTALMGGTLPVLSRVRVQRLGEIGTGIGSLYGINTLGAVVGATAAGFFLLPTVGLRGSIYLAAVVNLGLALVAYAVHLTQPQTEGAGAPEEPGEPAASPRRG
ncbi:MAG: spermidine synthase, partial [Armatimonadetes bacterium]|nr:spermidine synthase [Armatimonadota bacterium]